MPDAVDEAHWYVKPVASLPGHTPATSGGAGLPHAPLYVCSGFNRKHGTGDDRTTAPPDAYPLPVASAPGGGDPGSSDGESKASTGPCACSLGNPSVANVASTTDEGTGMSKPRYMDPNSGIMLGGTGIGWLDSVIDTGAEIVDNRIKKVSGGNLVAPWSKDADKSAGVKDFAKAVGRSAQHVLDTPGAIGEIGGGSGSPSGNGKTVSVATLDLLGRLTRIADKTGTAIIESTKAAVRAAADPENWIPLVPAYKGGLNLGDVVAEAYKAYLEETVTPGVTARKCSDAINALLDDEDAQDEVMGQALAAVIQIWVFGRLVKISVPNPTEVSVGQKVLRYLLDKDHLKGRDKAIWLEKALGFTKRNAEQFISQIRFDPCLAQATALTPHGQKYEQIIRLIGANGRQIDVRFIWIRDSTGVVRLVTMLPS